MAEIIEKKVEEFVKSALEAAGKSTQITKDQVLLNSGLLDSLFVIDFVLFAESEFDLDFSQDNITTQDIGTLADMIRIVKEKASH